MFKSECSYYLYKLFSLFSDYICPIHLSMFYNSYFHCTIPIQEYYFNIQCFMTRYNETVLKMFLNMKSLIKSVVQA